MSAAHDLVIIGGGTAGLSAAQAAVAMGKRPLIVAEGPLGGECTWNGCVPSKALIEAARVHRTAARAASFGTVVTGLSVDFAAVMRRVHEVISRIAGYEDESHLEAAGIAVRRGRARLLGAGRLEVDGEEIAAERVVIATGSRPAVPPITGLDTVPYLTNESLFALTSLPPRLVVVGAGPIGLEMAQSFCRLGSDVVVIDVVDKFLPREDAEVAAVLRAALEREGVRIELGVTTRRVAHDGAVFTLDVELGGHASTLQGEALLVATGRRPNVDGLGLEDAGVEVARTGVVVNSHLQTSATDVFAAGDVTGILPFTHVAAYQGRLAARSALGKRSNASYRVVPWVTFTEPEVAHLGLTEAEARSKHGDGIRVATLPFTAIDRAVIIGETEGLIKLITKGRPVVGGLGGGELLGAHIVGPGAGELIHELVLGMQVRAFAGRLAQAIHAYPAMSIGVQQAAAQLFTAGRATAGEMREDLRGVDR